MQISNPPTANDLIALGLDAARQQPLEELTESAEWAPQFISATISTLNSDKVVRHYFKGAMCGDLQEDKVQHALTVGAIALELSFGRPVAVRFLIEFGFAPLLAATAVCANNEGNYDTVDIVCTIMAMTASFAAMLNGQSRSANAKCLSERIPLTPNQVEIVMGAARDHDERSLKMIPKLKH